MEYTILNTYPKYLPVSLYSSSAKFLDQARAWFLKIDRVRIFGMRACVRVCVSAPEAINNYWCDMKPV